LSGICPGSSRIGIKLRDQAHPALESTLISRLIYGLENARGRTGWSPVGVDPGRRPCRSLHFSVSRSI
jgi:hypothetical protein